MISNCGKDERGKYIGGKAGDQTGGEWHLIPFYRRPWNCVLRYPDAKVRKLIAELAKKAAENNHIGYDQSQRLTFWQQLQRVKYRPENIKVNCEADCSSGVFSIVKAVGYLLNINKFKTLPISTTHYMRSELAKVGFKVLTEQKYLDSDEYLLAGDILLNDQHHTAINVTDGIYTKPKTKKGYTGEFPKVTAKTNLKKGSKGVNVERLQKLLNWAIGANLKVDGIFGTHTENAVKAFQKLVGIKVDGIFGTNSLKKAKEFKK